MSYKEEAITVINKEDGCRAVFTVVTPWIIDRATFLLEITPKKMKGMRSKALQRRTEVVLVSSREIRAIGKACLRAARRVKWTLFKRFWVKLFKRCDF